MMSQRTTEVVSRVLLVMFISGCATRPDKISASYVSPLQYEGYSCKQIRGELRRVQQKVGVITGVQNKEATKDAWAMGLGLVVFWPALFFLIGSDKKDELSTLKGEYEALEHVAIQKECSFGQDAKSAGSNQGNRQTVTQPVQQEVRKNTTSGQPTNNKAKRENTFEEDL